ncbi:putative quinol monooxygenase [Actinoplanes sp. NPDC051851]|uniref:putative quinol monooxygenase n=1 Tax=Actinoplanes sp. NPDC051851 TaxID=3154753 RepID=UPI00342A9FAC
MGYVVRAVWTANEGSEEIVLDALRELAPPSREEPGNQFYQAYQDPEQPRVFHLFEIYDDEEAYKAHGESEHFQRLAFGKAIPVLEKRERAFFQTLDV